MDLRAYYKKVREIESRITGSFVVLVSLETGDGGRPGVKTEVHRLSAAKQVVEGRARLATAEETDAFHEQNREANRLAENAAAVNRMQFVVVPTKSPVKGAKE